jgi:hypothetical protein
VIAGTRENAWLDASRHFDFAGCSIRLGASSAVPGVHNHGFYGQSLLNLDGKRFRAWCAARWNRASWVRQVEKEKAIFRRNPRKNAVMNASQDSCKAWHHRPVYEGESVCFIEGTVKAFLTEGLRASLH